MAVSSQERQAFTGNVGKLQQTHLVLPSDHLTICLPLAAEDGPVPTCLPPRSLFRLLGHLFFSHPPGIAVIETRSGGPRGALGGSRAVFPRPVTTVCGHH